MDIEQIRLYCLDKPGVSEGFPFGEDVLVFKVKNKIFALMDVMNPVSINLKCEPELAVSLREEFSEVIPGYHMNKKHWNTVSLTGRLGNERIRNMIDHSYDLVVAALPKKERENLEGD